MRTLTLNTPLLLIGGVRAWSCAQVKVGLRPVASPKIPSSFTSQDTKSGEPLTAAPKTKSSPSLMENGPNTEMDAAVALMATDKGAAV